MFDSTFIDDLFLISLYFRGVVVAGYLFGYPRKGMASARIGARDDCGRHVKLEAES